MRNDHPANNPSRGVGADLVTADDPDVTLASGVASRLLPNATLSRGRDTWPEGAGLARSAEQTH